MNTFTKPWFARFKNELWLLMETDSPIDSSILAICAARYFAAGMNSKQAALATADYFRLTYCRLHTSASDGSPLPSYFAHDPAPVILPAYPVILPANGAFALDLLQTLEDRAKDVNYYIEKLKQHLADTADTFEDNIKTTVNITLNKPITLADFLDVNSRLKFAQNQRFEIVGFLALLVSILWFDPRREHSSIPTTKARSRRAQGLSRLAAPSRPPEGPGLDRPEHGGTLVRLGLEGLASS